MNVNRGVSRKMIFRHLPLAGSLLLCSSLAIAGTNQFNIQQGSMADALNSLAEQADIQLLFPYQATERLRTNALVGQYSTEEALSLLLKDTGFAYQVAEDGTVVVSTGATGWGNDAQGEEGRALQRENLRKEIEIEEMVVTATKRETSLQDTPMSITALGGDEIDRRGLVSGDFLRSVPNINFVEFTPGFSTVTIRGLNTGFGSPDLSSSYLGEVPLSFSHGNLTYRSDLKMVDLDRAEILRGPQGTLYGANGMSGLVRKIPRKPNLERIEGYIDAGFSSLSHSDDLSNKQVGVLNLPLVEDELALRVAAYRFENAGFRDLVSTSLIEDVAAFTGTTVAIEKDENPSEFIGGRATLLWRPTEQLQMMLMLAHQKDEMKGRNAYSVFDPDAGGYNSIALEEEPGFRDAAHDVRHLLLQYDFGWVELTSASTWVDFGSRWHEGDSNYSRYYGNLAWDFSFDVEMESFVQEIRLSSRLSGPLQFTAGVFYEDLDSRRDLLGLWVGTQASLEALMWAGTDPLFQDLRETETTRQSAVFGEVEYAFNEQWTAILGGRWFDYDRERVEQGIRTGVVILPEPLGINERDSTFKTGIRYTPDDDTMLYASWAQGFRLGRGQSLPPSSICDVDGNGRLDFTDAPFTGSVNTDRTENYELGTRLSFLDKRLTANATLYRVDWSDIPVTVASSSSICNFYITVNSGKARSQGLELEMRYYLTSNLELSFGAAYTDTQFLDDSIGGKGDRLPLAPKYNGNLGMEYQFPLVGLPAFVRSDYSFSSGSLPSVSNRGGVTFPESDSYALWNVRIGIDFDSFSLQMFGKNLTGEDSVIFQDTGGVWRLPPRELGVDVKYHF